MFNRNIARLSDSDSMDDCDEHRFTRVLARGVSSSFGSFNVGNSVCSFGGHLMSGEGKSETCYKGGWPLWLRWKWQASHEGGVPSVSDYDPRWASPQLCTANKTGLSSGGGGVHL